MRAPRRSATDALEQIRVAFPGGQQFVFEADIRDFFGTIDHDRLLVEVDRRVSDRRVLTLLRSWLRAGVLDQGVVSATVTGTPQGGLCAAAHNPPYEQRWVMRSAWRLPVVGAVAAVGRCA